MAPTTPQQHHHHHQQLNIPNPLNIVWTNQPTKKWWQYIVDIFALLIPILGGLVGYYYVNKWEGEREQSNKLRDTTIQYSIDAFDQLTKAFALNVQEGKGQEEMQIAFTKIQLFGSSEQIAIIKFLIEKTEKGEPVKFDTILASLRNGLREQIKMPLDTSKIFVVTKQKQELSRGLYILCTTTAQYSKIPMDYSMVDSRFQDAKVLCGVCNQTHTFNSSDIKAVP